MSILKNAGFLNLDQSIGKKNRSLLVNQHYFVVRDSPSKISGNKLKIATFPDMAKCVELQEMCFETATLSLRPTGGPLKYLVSDRTIGHAPATPIT